MAAPKILLIGYGGVGNTGPEALLHADIEDLRAVFGDRDPASSTLMPAWRRNQRGQGGA